MPFDIIFFALACLIWFSSTTAYSVLLGTLILTFIFSLDKTDNPKYHLLNLSSLL